MKHKQVRWIIYFPLENKIYLCNCKIQPHNRSHITFHFLKNTLYCITHMYLRLNKFCIQCFANIICTQADLILLLLCILLFRKNFYISFLQGHTQNLFNIFSILPHSHKVNMSHLKNILCIKFLHFNLCS